MSRMQRFDWIGHLVRRSRQRQLTTAEKLSHYRRLRCEPLEDRRMLATFMVMNSADSGADSLRDAIASANIAPGADEITFDASLSGQTISLTSGELEITEALVITGLGQDELTIDAQQNSRIFYIDRGAGPVTLTGLTLTGGDVSGGRLDGGAILSESDAALFITDSTISGNSTSIEASGGGIYSRGPLTVINSTVSENSIGGSFGVGGGLASGNDLTVVNSTIANNHAYTLGGGLFSWTQISVRNSTISGNSAGSDDGGGILAFGAVTIIDSTISGNSAGRNGGGIWAIDTVSIVNSTISSNSADRDGGGIWIEDEFLTTNHSIIAGNTAGDIGPDLFNEAGGFSLSYSLISDNAGTNLAEAQTADASGNLIGSAFGGGVIDPLLGPLADNGGPTETHALLLGSPAIDAGDPAFVGPPDFDQRGAPFVRVADGDGIDGARIDMGAFEVPDTFLVDTDLDVIDVGDGLTSLREAIDAANSTPGPNNINFASALTGSTLSLTEGELAITEALSIAGLGQDDLTIDAQGQSRIFNIDDGGVANDFPVALGGLTLTGGRTTGDNASSLDTTNSGGAIRSLTSGPLTIYQSTISGSSTEGIRASGGGVFASGDVTLTGSTISGNSTAGWVAGGGGLVVSGGYSEVIITRSTISGNSTAGSFASGGGILTGLGDVTVTDSSVSGNSTTGQNSEGGGIFSQGGVVTLTRSTVSDNHAEGEDANGGGVFTNFFGDVTLIDSTISGNSAAGAGGVHTVFGNITLTGSTVSGNSTTSNNADGGGVSSLVGAVTLTDSTISDNHGGGVFTSRDITLTDSTVTGNNGSGVSSGSNVTLTRSTVSGNNGRGVSSSYYVTLTDSTVSGNSSADSGGGVSSGGTVTITRSTVSGNSSGRSGGGVAADGAVTLTDSTVTDNEADGAGGGVWSGGAVTITLSTISGNSTTGFDADGGGVYAGDDVTVADSTISDNSIVGDRSAGGGLFVDGFLTITDSTVSGNSTAGIGGRGGGVYAFRTVTITRSTISGNSTAGDDIARGGGVLARGLATITDSTISGNSTAGERGDGGGISAGGVTFIRSTVSGNRTKGEDADGGGVFARGFAILTDSTVSGNNTAGDNARGGGVYAGSDVTSTDSTVSGNSTSGSGASGGGMWVSDAVTLTHSTVTDNHARHASAFVGGVGSFDDPNAPIVITGSIVAGNTAGGGLNDLLTGVRLPGTDALTVEFSLIGDRAGTGLAEAQTADALGNLIGITLSPIDPLLGPLADNGGPTKTHALLLGSPAIDAGDPATVFDPAEFDQRGAPFARVVDGGAGAARIDMGAYEDNSSVLPPAVIAVVRNGGGQNFDKLVTLAFTFTEDVSASLDELDLVLENTSTQVPVDLTSASVTWDGGTNTATWDLSSATIEVGFHTATLTATGIIDADANALDGDVDGTGGDDFQTSTTLPFAGAPTTLLVALPGDTDLDADIDSGDIQNILAANSFGNAGAGPGPGGEWFWEQGDFNNDGLVTNDDIQLILAINQFGAGAYAATESSLGVSRSPIAPIAFSAPGVSVAITGDGMPKHNRRAVPIDIPPPAVSTARDRHVMRKVVWVPVPEPARRWSLRRRAAEVDRVLADLDGERTDDLVRERLKDERYPLERIWDEALLAALDGAAERGIAPAP